MANRKALKKPLRQKIESRLDVEIRTFVQKILGFEILALVRRSDDAPRVAALTPIGGIALLDAEGVIRARHKFASPVSLDARDELHIVWHTMPAGATGIQFASEAARKSR